MCFYLGFGTGALAAGGWWWLLLLLLLLWRRRSLESATDRIRWKWLRFGDGMEKQKSPLRGEDASRHFALLTPQDKATNDVWHPNQFPHQPQVRRRKSPPNRGRNIIRCARSAGLSYGSIKQGSVPLTLSSSPAGVGCGEGWSPLIITSCVALGAVQPQRLKSPATCGVKVESPYRQQYASTGACRYKSLPKTGFPLQRRLGIFFPRSSKRTLACLEPTMVRIA